MQTIANGRTCASAYRMGGREPPIKCDPLDGERYVAGGLIQCTVSGRGNARFRERA